MEVKRDKQNTKTIEFIKEFIKTQDTWKKINPDMQWKKQDETTIKGEKKVKKKIKKAQQRFKYYHNKRQKPHTIRMEDWMRVNKKKFL
jgi:hypothetical protein